MEDFVKIATCYTLLTKNLPTETNPESVGIHTKGSGTPLKPSESSESNDKVSQTTHIALLRDTALQN